MLTCPVAQIHYLTLEQAISVIALALWYERCYEDRNADALFTPDHQYARKLLKGLVKAGLIAEVNQLSDDFFCLAGAKLEQSISFKWNVSSNYRSALINGILDCEKNNTWPKHWSAQIQNVAFSLALSECKKFYSHCAKQRNFRISDCGESDVEAILSELLHQDHSVAQCSYIMLESAKEASDYFVTTACDPYKAAEYMAMTCRQFLNKVTIDNPAPAIEQNSLDSSIMHHVLYEVFLKKENGYSFNLPLSHIISRQS